MHEYLLHFTPTFPQFHLPELHALLSPYNYTLKSLSLPFYIILCEPFVLNILLNKSIFLKSIVELDFETIKNKKYRIKVISHGQNITKTRKMDLKESVLHLIQSSTIDLYNPDVVMMIYLIDDKIFTGLLLNISKRKEMLRFKVPNRPFIGITAMDWELSIFMANVCMAPFLNDKESCFVLDPFAGSGGILMAFAMHNCQCIAVDKTKSSFIGSLVQNSNCRTNLIGTTIYDNLTLLDRKSNLVLTLLSDAFTLKLNIKVDFIATDPPYGDKIGLQNKKHIDFIKALKNICDQNLKEDGKVAFWILKEEKESVDEIFVNYEKKFMIEQRMNTLSRVLFVYKKNVINDLVK